MSGPEREAEDPEVVRRRIAAELAALGEDPLGDEEDDEALAFALGEPDVDVATVQTLAGWARDEGDEPALSELAQARVWRTVELRTKRGPGTAKRRSAFPLVGTVVALVAIAAGLMLVPVLTPDGPEVGHEPVATAPAVTAEELEALSIQARAGLEALDRLSGEPRGRARAAAMAEDYARRLEAEG